MAFARLQAIPLPELCFTVVTGSGLLAAVMVHLRVGWSVWIIPVNFGVWLCVSIAGLTALWLIYRALVSWRRPVGGALELATPGERMARIDFAFRAYLVAHLALCIVLAAAGAIDNLPARVLAALLLVCHYHAFQSFWYLAISAERPELDWLEQRLADRLFERGPDADPASGAPHADGQSADDARPTNAATARAHGSPRERR